MDNQDEQPNRKTNATQQTTQNTYTKRPNSNIQRDPIVT